MNVNSNLLLTIIQVVLSLASALLSFYLLYKVYKLRLQKAEIEKRTNEIELKTKEIEQQMLKDECAFRADAQTGISQITNDIASDISKNLLTNTKWLDQFMDMSGSTFSTSVYGDRIKHFYHEKLAIAKYVIKYIDNMLEKEKKKICMLIDSGTTTYPLFIELCNLLKNKEVRSRWIENVIIVSNNIPGIQYLMKYGKDNPSDNYSEVLIKCLLMPGKPLSVYAAITGKQTEKWINNIDYILSEETLTKREDFIIIGFVTGNYIAAEYDEKMNIRSFQPVARGEGHVETKEIIVDKSDKVFLLAPLMKYSFANDLVLNHVNAFSIDRNTEDAIRFPKRVKYSKISVDTKKSYFFTTKRLESDRFKLFYDELSFDLKRIYSNGNGEVHFIDDFKLKDWLIDLDRKDPITAEIESEIPHNELREKFPENNIWSKGFVLQKIQDLKSNRKQNN